MTSRIVVPLDQSQVSESALPLAKALARQQDARITLLSVIEAPSSFGHYVHADERSHPPSEAPRRTTSDITPLSPYGTWTGTSWHEPSPKQIEEVASDTAQAERYLKSISESIPDALVETAVRLGSAADRILEAAKSRDNATIVMASHGRSGLGRAVIGSVATRVVQAATSPVFVVRATPESSAAAEVLPIRKVLVPVDGSTFAERVMPILQQAFGAENLEIHLTSVIETPRFANRAQSEEYVRWLAEQVSGSGTTATWDVSQGAPSIMINKAAAAYDVDLIAMATHGRSGLNRFVLGSVAERVLQDAEKPLMLVPARG